MGKSMRALFLLAGIMAVLIIYNFMIKGSMVGVGKTETDGIAPGEDLVITKNEITEIAKFYPYQFGNTKMEIVAVKANDGTIRTALNTCQVCYDSGRGYYVQEGNELVCQNCRNRFQIEQVEKIKGGCNPVPILQENKTEDDSNIVISGKFLASSAELFSNWHKE
ncbi:DUF2318 domain-containing protein [Candidatus Formimonas warabiya]|uniref:Membrane iron-sulfur containing protein FtrD-like domain-containing protein n=1 Tax=Formimonas warabiya TaxID=1761012 RepID=A0A3G1KZT2_FORW1|nr:DUF2318 domain-containing protein [Candidatus Formimonas warabiya]ATW28043.1 hypothetical protein DCMF_27760 [Candidatus Formimonas warabiya]